MFSISSRVDYGLLILCELMHSGVHEYRSLADIAAKHKVSQKYLSQVMIPLRQHGLVTSREGKGGGYALAREPAAINLRNVIEAIDGPLQLTRCMDGQGTCPAEGGCLTKPVWNNLKQSIYTLLEQRNLVDLTVWTNCKSQI